MAISPPTAFDTTLGENALRLYRLIAKFKNEYGYNTYQSSIRATILFLTELLKDQEHMSFLEMKLLISKMTEIELARRGLPMPKLVVDHDGRKFFDLSGMPVIAKLPGIEQETTLLELPNNTLTILIITVMNDARLKCLAFTDDIHIPFIDVGDLFEQART